ncbi:MAG: hypothetical protein K8R54_01440 [Bacteroidales bacterium]|nr:hypothetical protein [Bacteroidales bacterium]
MKKSTRITAVVLLFFNGLSAAFGGYGLIADPSGEKFQMPIEFLEYSPFVDFLIPGIILFTVNGMFNLFVGILGILKKKIFAILTLLCGTVLAGWLSIQIIIIREFYAPLHLSYYITGSAMMFLGYLMLKQLRFQQK